MTRHGLVLGITLFAILLISGASRGVAQNQLPDEKPRKVKREDNRAFRDWPKSDVKLIITPEEEDAYDKLKTNEERENFIHEFWNRRDPSPDTEENEYKDEYYERIAYANEHFTSGKPGWLTDRGRIYVRWGKPNEVESHPSGGPYQSTNYYNGSTPTFPFEKWFYRYLPGVGSGIEIEFVDPSGSGEYRMARNPFEKEAGPYSNTREGVNGFGDPNSRREQDGPFYVTELMKNLETPPPVEGRGNGLGTTHSPITEDGDALNFEIRTRTFFQSDGSSIAAFTVQTDNQELVFQDSGGLQTAKLNIVGRVLTVTNKKLGSFEDIVTTTATREELADAKRRQSVYGKAVILPPGQYRLDVLIRDTSSGAQGFQQKAFTVPRRDDSKLQISSIVLAAKLESLNNPVGSNQFTIGRNKVIPNISGIFHRGAPVGIYLQVYNTGIDQTTLRPSVDVEYVLTKDGKELRKQAEDWVGMSDTGARLTLARLFETEDLAPGKYEIQIRINDHVTGQKLTPATEFTVVK